MSCYCDLSQPSPLSSWTRSVGRLGTFGDANQNILAQVLLDQEFQPFTIDKFHTAVVTRLLPALRREPGGRHQYALPSLLLLHRAGQLPDMTNANGVLVPLRLHDGQPADYGCLVGNDRVDTIVITLLRGPADESLRLEKLPNQMLEVGIRHLH